MPICSWLLKSSFDTLTHSSVEPSRSGSTRVSSTNASSIDRGYCLVIALTTSITTFKRKLYTIGPSLTPQALHPVNQLHLIDNDCIFLVLVNVRPLFRDRCGFLQGQQTLVKFWVSESEENSRLSLLHSNRPRQRPYQQSPFVYPIGNWIWGLWIDDEDDHLTATTGEADLAVADVYDATWNPIGLKGHQPSVQPPEVRGHSFRGGWRRKGTHVEWEGRLFVEDADKYLANEQLSSEGFVGKRLDCIQVDLPL